MSPHEARSDGTFDFRDTSGFAKAYLRTYYSGAPPVDEQILSRFLVRVAPHLPAGAFAEVGCGPTVHHIAPIVPFVREVHALDYLEENLAEVRAWKDRRPGAHDWRAFTRATLRDAGERHDADAIETRESLMRTRLTHIGPVDLLQATPADELGRYPSVGCFYCAEEIGISLPAWSAVVGRVSERVAPGGTLLMAALAEMDGYDVVDAAGGVSRLPCARISARDVREVLTSLGFPEERLLIEQHAIPEPDVGVGGTILVAARGKVG